MSRAWVSRLAFVSVVAALSCGGKTEAGSGAATGGGAGAGGSAAGSGGNAGSSAGAAGTAASWSSCQGPGWCKEQYNGCCGPCGLQKISDLSGVHVDPAQINAFRASQCSDPNPTCPGCAMQVDPNLTAFCVGAQCQMIDVRTDSISACTQDSDCTMRYPDCCELCGGPAPDLLIAIHASKASEYSSQVCGPFDGACPPCVPEYPADWVAYCGADGHCQVAQVQSAGCPPQPPVYGEPCSVQGLTCTWGDDPRIHCRNTADCVNGQWAFLPMEPCVPLSPPGADGCPSDLSASGKQCAGSEGKLCNMTQSAGAGAMCVCSQCLGGPCSQYGHWWCDLPPAGCPSWAPNLGQPCSAQGQLCIYGACGTEVSVGRRCGETGRWEEEWIACPE